VTFLRQAVAIAAKDLRIEVRGRHALNGVLPFAATVLVAFGLSLGPGRSALRATAPGLLWLAVLFATVLGVRQSFRSEADDGAMDGLVLAPVDKAAVFAGKALAVVAQLLALEVVVVALVAVLFGLSLADPVALAFALTLGTIGLAAVGSLFGVLEESAKAREAVFPLLVLPLSIPVLVAGVRATELAAAARGGEALPWLSLLVAFDLVVVGAGTLVFGHLMED
jgi:heme exporter protein B